MKSATDSELFIVLFVKLTLWCCVHLATHHSLTSGNAEERLFLEYQFLLFCLFTLAFNVNYASFDTGVNSGSRNP